MMQTSETLTELIAAMSKAQAKICGATKDKKNEHFKSKYADLSSVVDAIREPVTSVGLAWVQVTHEVENAACVETVIMHTSGQMLCCGRVAIPVSKHDAHGFGSALTYARRYSLAAAFGVAPEDDDGNAAAAARPLNPGSAKAVAVAAFEALPQDQKDKLRALADEITNHIASGSPGAAVDLAETLEEQEEKLALWSLLGKTTRTAFKDEQAKRKAY